MIHNVKKGLNIPILGAPKQIIDSEKKVKRVAIVASDYVGMKPTMKVLVGDEVKVGQVLFECKKNEGVLYTSPGNGTVKAINRGPKRVFESIVIELKDGAEEHTSFSSYKSGKSVSDWSREEITQLLLESGDWTALRARPFSKNIPVGGPSPHSIFITAVDTNPLAADPNLTISEFKDDFKLGVELISRLSDGKTYLCGGEDSDFNNLASGNIEVHQFVGPHPAGNVGTHIHTLDPVSEKKTVWHIGYQDVIAIGKLFATGQIWTGRVIALTGPEAINPRLVKTRLGACVATLIDGEAKNQNGRVVSGGILNGRIAAETFAYLGRFHNQISLLEEGTQREFFGWQAPGVNKFSVKRTFVSKFFPGKKFAMTTGTHGSFRAMVPVGSYEALMPLDILPTQLLRALYVKDTETAIDLGCLELDEEDIALLTFAAPEKVDYGLCLREALTVIEKEG